MSEVRFEASKQVLAVLDGFCNAGGKSRTEVINQILEEWTSAKLHEAILICRVAGVNPQSSESKRNNSGP